jgi:DNA repair exonuclease SbcCD nuclease subunit
MNTMRIVFFADTHLGFDFPVKPRIERRRRGPDFFDNFHRVLDYARRTRPDFLLHGGDLFFRAKVPQLIVDMVYQDLFEFAGEGIQTLIVPGNHERSILPASLFLSHPNLYVFDKPLSFNFEVRGAQITFSGFPCRRKSVREEFNPLLKASGWENRTDGWKFLCLHQTIEGAQVGPTGYTFRKGQDVIPKRSLPRDAIAVLSGHIHRQQVLGDLEKSQLSVPPVIYPGSIERTSFAEKDERKGFYDIEVERSGRSGWRIGNLEFIDLPARPMKELLLESWLTQEKLVNYIKSKLSEMDPDSIVRLKCDPDYKPGC